MHRLPLLAALGLAGCGPYVPCVFDPDACNSETGDDGEELYCSSPYPNGRWICLLAPKDDFRVQHAIDNGVLVPSTNVGDCPFRGREWDALVRADPIVSNLPPLRAAECSDTKISTTDRFSICLPEQSAWHYGGAQGAVPVGGNWTNPDCGELGLYAFAYDYLYAARCAAGVACMTLSEECACKCPDDSTCNAMQSQLEVDYFGEDQDGLIPGGWESACTGYPWAWDPQAFGSGAYRGTSCEWNSYGPMPGDIPMPLDQLIDEIECTPTACTIPSHIVETIAATPDLITASPALSIHDGAIVIHECDQLCRVLGIEHGDEIIDIGGREPTTLAAWNAALDQLLAGHTQVTIQPGRGDLRVLRISLKD